MSPMLRRESKKAGKVYGLSGMCAVFNAEGVADVDVATAAHFSSVPGYEVVDAEGMPFKQPTGAPEAPVTPPEGVQPPAGVKHEIDPGDPDNYDERIDAFMDLSWQKQRAAIEKGTVQLDILQVIDEDTEDRFSDAVKKAAKTVLATIE